MWNTNWFSNMILIPNLVGESCLLLLQAPEASGGLTPSQLSNCKRMTARSFNTFNYSVINGLGKLTGANTLDVASIGIANGLLAGDASVVGKAYEKVHAEVVVQNAIRSDGIKPDGSFAQHAGILYIGR